MSLPVRTALERHLRPPPPRAACRRLARTRPPLRGRGVRASAAAGPAPGPALDGPAVAKDGPALPGDPRLVGSPEMPAYDEELTQATLEAAPGNLTEDSTLTETLVTFGFTLAIGVLLVVTAGVAYLSFRDFLDRQEQDRGRKALERDLRERAGAKWSDEEAPPEKRPSERANFKGFGD